MSDVAVYPVELDELDETYDIDVDTNQLMNVELATPIQIVASNDYEDLINKPSINGVELSGNESLADLSIPTDTADLTNGAGFISAETDPVFLASPAYDIESSDIASWNNKSDFSGSYNDLTDKPTIPTVPTNVSAFNNDAGYLTSYTETDPTVPNWAKASTKPSYTASEVHALPDTTVIPSKVSDLTNDAGYITGYTETDPTVPAWAKASTKPTYTASEVGALPSTTPIPSKTSDLTNDSGFITTASIPSNVSAFTNDAGYLTLATLPIYNGGVQ